MQVRCGSCGSSCGDGATVLVEVEVDITPNDLGNSLRTVRNGLDVAMSWSSDPNASTYALYRHTDKTVWPPAPFDPAVPTNGTTLTGDVPWPPPLYFYRTAGKSCSGAEGP